MCPRRRWRPGGSGLPRGEARPARRLCSFGLCRGRLRRGRGRADVGAGEAEPASIAVMPVSSSGEPASKVLPPIAGRHVAEASPAAGPRSRQMSTRDATPPDGGEGISANRLAWLIFVSFLPTRHRRDAQISHAIAEYPCATASANAPTHQSIQWQSSSIGTNRFAVRHPKHFAQHAGRRVRPACPQMALHPYPFPREAGHHGVSQRRELRMPDVALPSRRSSWVVGVEPTGSSSSRAKTDRQAEYADGISIDSASPVKQSMLRCAALRR